MKLAAALVFGLCAVVALGAITTDEADVAIDEVLDMAMDEGEEDMYGEDEIDFSAVTGPVVYTRSHIIGTPEGRVPVNKELSVVCALVNEGEDPLLVQGITGTLHDPNDLSQVKMNFTGVSINETLAGDSEISYSYRFMMPANTPMESFHMMFHVFYTSGESQQQGMSTYYNSTVEMYETDEFDWHTFSVTAEKVGMFFAVVGTAVALAVYSQDSSNTFTAPSSSSISASSRSRGKSSKKSSKKRN